MRVDAPSDECHTGGSPALASPATIEPRTPDAGIVPATLLAAFQQARVGMALVDADGRVLLSNKEMTRLVGFPVVDWASFPSVVRQLADGQLHGCQEAVGPHGHGRAGWTTTTLGNRYLVQGQDITSQYELEQTLLADAKRLTTIVSLHRDIGQVEFDVDDIVEWVIDRARTLFGASEAGIGFIEGDEIVYRIVTGPRRERNVGIRTPVTASMAGICVRTGETMRCDDSETDPRVDQRACRAAGLRSMVIVPLRHRGQIVGVLNVTSAKVAAFDEDEVASVEVLAGIISAAYGHATDLAAKRTLLGELNATVEALKRSEIKLAYEAVHDPLTGLPNRTLFLDRLHMALAGTAGHEEPVGLFFIDIDRFKMVNDSLGHDAGDVLLVELSHRLSGCLRPEDSAARLGGDEFVVLCQGLPGRDGAILIAQRIRAGMAGRVGLPGGKVFPTVSIGVALSDGGADTPHALLKKADLALYHAKQRGRDRYEVFTDHLRPQAADRLAMQTQKR